MEAPTSWGWCIEFVCFKHLVQSPDPSKHSAEVLISHGMGSSRHREWMAQLGVAVC